MSGWLLALEDLAREAHLGNVETIAQQASGPRVNGMPPQIYLQLCAVLR